MKSGVDPVAQENYTLTDRSQTALLDAPYALTILTIKPKYK